MNSCGGVVDCNTGIIVDSGQNIYYFICEHERIRSVFIFTKCLENERQSAEIDLNNVREFLNGRDMLVVEFEVHESG